MAGKIGILDSGVGGLTVVREIQKQLPHEGLIYIGDNARCPYGPRSEEEICQFTEELVSFLLYQGIKLLIIACNTATAVCYQRLKERLTIPVVGMINPGSRGALRAYRGGIVGVIGTETTIKSSCYQDALLVKNAQLKILSLACPAFVNLVESGQIDTAIAKKMIAQTLWPVKHAPVDTLILGCTHFPLLAKSIQRFMGPKVTLINPAEEVAGEVAFYLDEYHLHAEKKMIKNVQYYTTGSAKLFTQIGSQWLGHDIQVKKVPLSNLSKASKYF